MPDKPQIPDQADILATNERLTTENARLTTELNAATDLLETAQENLTAATARATTLEAELKTKSEEVSRLTASNTELTAKQGDLNKAVAAEVRKLGLNPKAAEHKQPAADAALTPTQRVLAAKGVSSLAELSRKP